MKHTVKDASRAPSLSARLCAAIGISLLLALLLAAPASAGFEQVATFGESGEGAQLGNVTSLAVNMTGAGGVPPGTFYSVSDAGGGGHNSVSRFNAKGEFREAWGWEVSVGGKEEFERCGPDGEAAHPVCKVPGGKEGEGAGQLYHPQAVAVDQTTGYVYVLNKSDTFHVGNERAHNLIQVFSADGAQLIAAFGDAGEISFLPYETFEEGPEKIHVTEHSGIAVDDTGAVYISDGSNYGEDRVMVWKPQAPGDYEHYVYTGRANDIATNGHLAIDDANNLYSAGGDFINMFAPGEPDVPLCENEITDIGLLSMTVDPVSGEVFYYAEKTPEIIHQLSACNEQGKFVETGVITPPKPTGDITFAFNPSLVWEASRPSGVLYGANGGGHGYIFAPAEIHFPAVESESVSSVTATTATLNAQINPKGSNTRYVFQYLPKDAYEANPPGERFAGATEAPLGGTELGAGQEALGAATSLVGLDPDTEYHYRAIATSHCEPDEEENLCETTGEDEAFRTFPVEAPGLPDSRAWELVSPVQKNGGEPFPLEPTDGSGALCLSSEGGCKPGVGIPWVFPQQSSPTAKRPSMWASLSPPPKARRGSTSTSPNAPPRAGRRRSWPRRC